MKWQRRDNSDIRPWVHISEALEGAFNQLLPEETPDEHNDKSKDGREACDLLHDTERSLPT